MGSVDLDEVAHEPPHQDLDFLQIQIFSSLVIKELMQLQEFPQNAMFRLEQRKRECKNK